MNHYHYDGQENMPTGNTYVKGDIALYAQALITQKAFYNNTCEQGLLKQIDFLDLSFKHHVLLWAVVFIAIAADC